MKSTNHFYGGFAPVASELFYVNTGLLDGLTPYPNDPRKTAYTKLSRPIWPRVADPVERDRGLGPAAVLGFALRGS